MVIAIGNRVTGPQAPYLTRLANSFPHSILTIYPDASAEVLRNGKMTNQVWYGGEWFPDDKKILGPLDHAFWMATVAFDGARSFENVAPDLDLHCQRLIVSARNMLLEPTLTATEIEAISWEGVRRLSRGTAAYIRPAFFARRGFVTPVASSTDFALAIIEMPMPDPVGFAVCFSSFRRPAQDMAPTDAKAGCLYPNLQRALIEAKNRGFDNAITFDPNGNVAELATANIWMVKDAEVFTPAENGTFLAGVTRRRAMELLRRDGFRVHEVCLKRRDFEGADELFSTGNFGKVMPIIKLEGRAMPIGPVCLRARDLYWEFAHSTEAIH